MFQSIELITGAHLDLDAFLQNLTAFKYNRVKRVQQVGEYSIKGEIIEIFPVNFDGPVRVDLSFDKIERIASMNTRTGRSIWEHKIVIVIPNTTGKAGPFDEEIPLTNFINIDTGDYVVHNFHGIGRFLGMQELQGIEEKEEHLVIEYQGGDKLYVPKHDVHLVQKYIGFSKRPPRLFKLGTKEWQRIRAKIQKKLQVMAAELLHTQALRASLKGHAFSADTEWQKQFEAGFPYEETPDQIKSTEELKNDMEMSRPMDRLLCGDVGYGKTEVAMRAAFKAVMDGKQVAVLVPTTILAEQHCYNFKKRMKNFPVRIAMLSRLRTPREQAEIVKGVADGSVDIVIGTHRLLSKDIAFKDLGVIIIDEEQRFGVQSKEKLKRFRLLADVLTMTATPIPRTLHMAITGAKDLSVISTPPQNRIPVKTEIVVFDEDIIKAAIQKEMRRKGQVFFLHNRVEDIHRIAKIVKDLVPQARVEVGHGQMAPRELEEIMMRFLEGKVDVLVATTIVESGIDIPNANTIIINNAHYFGLADLHQLRGRVGRLDIQAYAYFIIPDRRVLSTEAQARIDAIEKFSGLGAGFNIAFEDLQIRGAGNILGKEQSGYISSIGFDLYCRLLKQSVEYLKQHKEEVSKHAKAIPVNTGLLAH
jgi:transcription-repair coupling factor (superfamily II helicase)